MSGQKCYMCDLPATSVEHVPPRCLFPEQKDLPPGFDLRKQLITVPSCDLHNGRKSHDDEYLLYALSMNVPNNDTASTHFGTKVLRAIKQNPSIISSFTAVQIPVVVEDMESGELISTVAVRVNNEQLTRALAMIGRALYFHHFGSSWSGDVSAYPHFSLALTEENAKELNEASENMAATVRERLKDSPSFGENKVVFSYQVADFDSATGGVMALNFFEGSRVTLLFRTKAPDDKISP
jgi:hypothetical protein